MKNGILIGNPIREVEPVGQHGHSTGSAKMATTPLPAPLQKHSLSGCTIDMTQLNCHIQTSCYFAMRHLVAAVFYVRSSWLVSRNMHVRCCRLRETASCQSSSWQLSSISVCNNGVAADIVACVLFSALLKRSHGSGHSYVSRYVMRTVLRIVCLCLVPGCNTQCNLTFTVI